MIKKFTTQFAKTFVLDNPIFLSRHCTINDGGAGRGHADGVYGRPRSRKDGCDVPVRCLQVPRLRCAATPALRKVQGPVVLQQRLSGEAGTVSLRQPSRQHLEGLRNPAHIAVLIIRAEFAFHSAGAGSWGLAKANALERV